MIDEKLKEKFLTTLRKEIPAEDGTIKLHMEVSEYIKDREDTVGNMNHLIDNLQAALKEFKGDNVNCSITPGYGSAEGINGIVFEATVACN